MINKKKQQKYNLYKYHNNRIPLIYLIFIITSRKEIDKLYNQGWFTPEEYQEYVDEVLSYEDMIVIYQNRKIDWAREYITDSYEEGYIDDDNMLNYIDGYLNWDEGIITDDEIENIMLDTLLIIKQNREQASG